MTKPVHLLCAFLLCCPLPALAQFGPSSAVPQRTPSSTSDISKELKPKFGFFLKADKATPEDQLAYARQLETDGKKKKASTQYRALLKQWPSSREAALAQFHYARLLDERGKTQKAIKAYEYLLMQYSGGFPHNEVLESIHTIGHQLLTEKKAKWMFGGFSSPDRAIPLLEYIIRYGPQWEKADEAQFMIGRAHQSLGAYNSAVEAFEKMAVHYPESDLMAQAAFYRAECLYQISSLSPNSEPAADEAWIALSRFLKRFEDSELAPQAMSYHKTIGRRRANALYEKGRYYDKIARRPKAALRTYGEYLRKFPGSEWTNEAQERIEVLTARMHADAEPEPEDTQDADD